MNLVCLKPVKRKKTTLKKITFTLLFERAQIIR